MLFRTHINIVSCDPFIFSAPSTLKLIVRVKVMKGYDAITGAKVNVQVGSTQWKLMKDDGLGRCSVSYFLISYEIKQFEKMTNFWNKQDLHSSLLRLCSILLLYANSG